jgi:hypothetical protein
MKVTIAANDGMQVSLNVSGSFKVLVDDEVLLEHIPVPEQAIWSAGSDASSLFKDFTNYFECPGSSFISAFEIDDNVLTVHFVNGNSASYKNVPVGEFEKLRRLVVNGHSAGKLYNKFIKYVYESV